MEGNFSTTQWTLVAEAGDTTSPEATEALGELFSTYWYPLYAYVRRTGKAAEEAQDLVQTFFMDVLEKNVFRVADRERGKFRWFLLATFKHFLANQRRGANALKRGGGIAPISLDSLDAEERYRLEPTDNTPADILYDRQWALTLIRTTRAQLESEFRAAGKGSRFATLAQYLPGAEPEQDQATAAAALDTTTGALKVEIYRLKKRFADTLREEVGNTVATPEGIDQEIRHLIDALYRR